MVVVKKRPEFKVVKVRRNFNEIIEEMLETQPEKGIRHFAKSIILNINKKPELVVDGVVYDLLLCFTEGIKNAAIGFRVKQKKLFVFHKNSLRSYDLQKDCLTLVFDGYSNDFKKTVIIRSGQ